MRNIHSLFTGLLTSFLLFYWSSASAYWVSIGYEHNSGGKHLWYSYDGQGWQDLPSFPQSELIDSNEYGLVYCDKKLRVIVHDPANKQGYIKVLTSENQGKNWSTEHFFIDALSADGKKSPIVPPEKMTAFACINDYLTTTFTEKKTNTAEYAYYPASCYQDTCTAQWQTWKALDFSQGGKGIPAPKAMSGIVFNEMYTLFTGLGPKGEAIAIKRSNYDGSLSYSVLPGAAGPLQSTAYLPLNQSWVALANDPSGKLFLYSMANQANVWKQQYAVAIPDSSEYFINSITYAPDKRRWVAVGYSLKDNIKSALILTGEGMNGSINYITLPKNAPSSQYSLQKVGYSGQKFVAIGLRDGKIPIAIVATSSDGITWEMHNENGPMLELLWVDESWPNNNDKK